MNVYSCPRCGERWANVREGLGRSERTLPTPNPPFGRTAPPPVPLFDETRLCPPCDRIVELALWRAFYLRPGEWTVDG